MPYKTVLCASITVIGLILAVGGIYAQDDKGDWQPKVERGGDFADKSTKTDNNSNSEKEESDRNSLDGFVVHEWGIIRIDLGDSGQLAKAFSPTVADEGNDLPYFVDRAEQVQGITTAARGISAPGVTTTVVASTGVRGVAISRAEEPFIYFYSKKAIPKVGIAVTMPMDRLSFCSPSGAAVARVRGVDNLCWENLSILPDKPKDKEIPRVSEKHWWAKARATDSAYVVTATDAVEKFLFYETAGFYKPPFEKLELADDGILRGELEGNQTRSNLVKGQRRSNVWLVSVGGDKEVCVDVLDEIKPSEKFESKITSLEYMKDPAREFTKLLKKAGLYEKEAQGLVEIRRNEFFETEGVRMLYLLTREECDTLFPMTITPKPSEMKRIMVIQIEFPNTKAQK